MSSMIAQCHARFWFSLSLGVATLVGLGGCGSGNDGEYREISQADLVPTSDHDDHEHAAPHGGHLMEVGDHAYQLELVFDEGSKDLTIYVLGPHAEDAVSATALNLILDTAKGEPELMLEPSPQAGDSGGKASRFQLAGSKLPASLTHEDDLAGHLTVEIDGKSYEVKIEADDDHDHDHGHDDHDDHDHAGE